MTAPLDLTVRPCVAATHHDVEGTTCPAHDAWMAYADHCLRYGHTTTNNPERLSAHIRFDRTVTVRTNSGAEVTIEQGEHHPAVFLDDYSRAHELAELADGGFGADEAWWYVAVEWVDCSVVHIPIAYINDADVSLLGRWTDAHWARYS